MDSAPWGRRVQYSLTTFSRSGKLLQIEYALNAVATGRTSLGICAKNGVVIATDKKIATPLVDAAAVGKIELIAPACGMVFAGMGPDYRVLTAKARKDAQAYYLTYRELMPTLQLVRASAAVMQEYTQSGGVRPFGVSLLVAGYDDDGPQLFQVDRRARTSAGRRARSAATSRTRARSSRSSTTPRWSSRTRSTRAAHDARGL